MPVGRVFTSLGRYQDTRSGKLVDNRTTIRDTDSLSFGGGSAFQADASNSDCRHPVDVKAVVVIRNQQAV